MDSTAVSGQAAAPSGARPGVVLGVLGLASFVVGTAELVVAGMLNSIVSGLDVPVNTAGQLVTGYALGICAGGPLLAAATSRIGRRRLLLAVLAAYAAGTVIAASAPDFTVLVFARVLTGALHGLLVGVATVIAGGLVPPERRGQAMGMIFGGIAVSTVIGAPLGTLIGQALGWRVTFWGIAMLAMLALAASALTVPDLPADGPSRLHAQARFALAPRVLAMLGLGLLLMGGQFTAFTYIAPFLTRVTGVPGTAVSGFLLAYGIAAAVGTFAGGRAADKNPVRTLVACGLVVVASLALIYLARSSAAVVVAAIAAWGLAGFGLVPSLQVRVVSLAGPGGDLAATLGASAVNAGIAAGALAGGWTLASHGAASVMPLAAVICAVAIPVAWASRWLSPPVPRDQPLVRNRDDGSRSDVPGDRRLRQCGP